MKFFIDDANVEEIKRLLDLYPIDGVSTNPSILAKQKKDPVELLKEIRKVIGKDALLFAQTLGNTSEQIVKDGKYLYELLGKNTIIKIPTTPEGIKAIKELTKLGIPTCGTTVYYPIQAFMAAKAGAVYVAPYVNRIDNLGYDGVAAVTQIHNIFKNNNMNCDILAASFKNSNQVLRLIENGVGSVTAAPSVIDNLFMNPVVDKAIDDFAKDFKNLTNKETFSD